MTYEEHSKEEIKIYTANDLGIMLDIEPRRIQHYGRNIHARKLSHMYVFTEEDIPTIRYHFQVLDQLLSKRKKKK